jgi:thiosulfate dehydrogenase [quinone] large subunit
VLDDHILGAITVVVLALVAAGNVWGLGKWWTSQDLVRKHPWLR